jgi:hypothetical protein
MNSTPLDMTTLLVAALAITAVFFLLRKKYDSNLPLFFYFVAVVFSNVTDRDVNPYILYAGVVFALLLRFEFMNQGFARVVAFFTTGTMCLIIYIYFAEIFGDGSSPF